MEFFIGIVIGMLTGIIPGLHPNTIATALSQFPLSNDTKASLLVGMMPSNIIASFIPAIFFGIPERGTLTCALAGQRLALDGRGLTALRVVLLSALIASFVAFLTLIPSMEIFPILYSTIANYVGHIVAFLAVILIIKSKNPLSALLVFLAAGTLGYFSLNSRMYDPYMPLFSGMFAISALLNITKSVMPRQRQEEPIGWEILPYSILGVFLGMVADLLPGISSPGQIAFFTTIVIPLSSLTYLATTSAIGISESIFSFSTAATLEKARIGTTAHLSRFIDIGENILSLASLFVFSAVLTITIAYLLRKRVAEVADLNSKPIAFILIVYLFVLCFILDGVAGVIVLSLASALGWLTARLNVERIQMMGAIVLPTILLLFRIFPP
ncbi:MAG: tripartite tricarboxylate transporter permease [Candidatus Bilamarchaeaceae archaeon]